MKSRSFRSYLGWLWCGLVLALLTASSVHAAPTPRPQPVSRKQKPTKKSWQNATMQAYAKAMGRSLPKVRGTTLAKTKRKLPSQLYGKVNLVLIAFARGHQKTIKTWRPHIKTLCGKHPGLDYMIIPVMNGFARLFGGLIEGGMRKVYKTQKARQRTLPLYYGRGLFEKGLKLRSTGQMIAILVDRKGRVLWQQAGPATKANLRSLHSRLRRLHR